MRKSIRIKAIGLAVCLVCMVAAIAFAATATGAYFSDTKAGAVTGTAGTIRVTTSGGSGVDGLVFNWTHMLPGEVYSMTATYQNTGDSVQDIWVVFPNRTSLSALNSLGTYGAARLTSTDGAYFYSNNLNDHPIDQGDVCKMLPQKIKIASNVGPTASGTMTFSFQYASKLAGGNGTGFAFNSYPVVKVSNTAPGGHPTGDGALPGYDQYFVDAGDGIGSGLPFQIVATQPGIEPGAAGTSAGF